MLDTVNLYYPHLDPQTSSFLGLSGALTAVGLIGIVYQFRTPLWALVLRIRGWWQRNLIGF